MKLQEIKNEIQIAANITKDAWQRGTKAERGGLLFGGFLIGSLCLLPVVGIASAMRESQIETEKKEYFASAEYTEAVARKEAREQSYRDAVAQKNAELQRQENAYLANWSPAKTPEPMKQWMSEELLANSFLEQCQDLQWGEPTCQQIRWEMKARGYRISA